MQVFLIDDNDRHSSEIDAAKKGDQRDENDNDAKKRVELTIREIGIRVWLICCSISQKAGGQQDRADKGCGNCSFSICYEPAPEEYGSETNETTDRARAITARPHSNQRGAIRGCDVSLGFVIAQPC